MALSGSASKGFARHSLIIEWSATQSIADNNSTVTAKVYLQSNDQYGAMDAPATNYGSVTVNGVTKSFSATSNLSANQKKLLTTQTFTVGHNADGTKSFSFSVTYNINVTFAGVFYGNQTASGTGTLNTIPRASSITSISGGTLGSPVTVTIARASSGFTHKVWYYRPNEQYIEVGSGVGTSLTFTPPIDDCALLPNATSGTAKVEIGTYQNGTLIGGYVSKVFTVSVPTTLLPTISNVALSELNTSLRNKFGGYVQHKSRVKAVMSASGVYASTISQKKITGNGQTANEFELNTSELQQAGSNVFAFEVTDSRGRKANWNANIDVIAYHDPRVDLITAVRCNADGSFNDEGTFVSVRHNAAIAPVGNKNDKAFKLRWRTKNSAWSEKVLSNANYNLSGTTILSGFSTDYSFELQLVVSDYFKTVEVETEVPTGFSLINVHNDGKGIAFGKVAQDTDHFAVAMRASFEEMVTFDHLTATGDAILNYLTVASDAEFRAGASFGGPIDANGGFGSRRISSGANLNGYTQPGFYHCPLDADANTMTNLPNKSAFSLFVERHAGVKQTFTIYHPSNSRTWIRSMYGDSWGPWNEVAYTNDISYGGSSNGFYIRFPNGTQICWMNGLTSSRNATAPHGSVFTTNNSQWNYPASFTGNPPAVTIQVDGGVAWSWAALGANMVNTSYCQWIGVSAVSSPYPIKASLVAIGRWK